MVYTYTMERTQIYLSEAELRTLDRLSRATGHTRSQLIREAIGRAYMKRSDQDETLERLEASSGTWTGKRASGRQQVERLRRGRLARLHTSS